MPKEFEQVYIGDGVYARWDGMSVLLETERDNGRHYIYLEQQHIANINKLVADYPDGRRAIERPSREKVMRDAAQIIAENASCSRCGAKLDGSGVCCLSDCPHV